MKIVALSRNFGHQPALTAGLEHARGDAVVMLDGDLQDPPEVIPQMLEQWRDGIDVVYAVRQERLRRDRVQAHHARAGSTGLFRRLTRLDLAVESGDFRLMDRRALDALLAMPERNRFLRGMTVWIGFTQTAVPFVREERHAGVTKYPLRKMLRFSFDAITSFSSAPLQCGDAPGLRLLRRWPSSAIPLTIVARYTNIYARGVPIDDRARPAAGRDPADHGRDHRRVRRAASTTRSSTGRCTWSASASTWRSPPSDEDRGAGGRRRAASSPRYRLTQAGHAVDVYERWPGLGGQAATLDVGEGHLLERYYHHLFSTDRHIAALYDELGMPDELEWITSSVAYFADGRQWPFVTPLDLLRFKPLPPLARVRLGAAVLAIQRGPGNPAPFESVTAHDWIEPLDGQRRLARAVGAAAARQVRRARRGHRDGVAAEQAAAAARRRRGRGEARLPAALVGAAVRRAARADRARRRARADRPPGGAPGARLRGHPGRAGLVPRAATTRATFETLASPSATTRCSRRCRAT